MASYNFKIAGRMTIDATIDVHRGIETASAWGLAFDQDADVIAETESTRYSGFCDAEIVYSELHRLFAGRWGIESEDIASAVDSVLPLCECEE